MYMPCDLQIAIKKLNFFYLSCLVYRMLPKYFVVQTDTAYKLYLNSVFKSEFTEDASTCVLWPLSDVSSDLVIRRYNPRHEHLNITRPWNGTDYSQTAWSYTGSEFSIVLLNTGLNIMAPLIQILHGLYDNLPYNPYTFRPNQSMIIEELDTSTYTAPIAYVSDPSLDENTESIEPSIPIAYPPPSSGRMHGIIPTAPPAPPAPRIRTPPPMARPPMARPPMARPPMARPAPPPSRATSMPQHVVKLVIAEAIRKKESCPISCDDITEENATLTSCGHVFTKFAIKTWLETPSSKNLCPVCKQECSCL
jgi:hypothetical protein